MRGGPLPPSEFTGPPRGELRAISWEEPVKSCYFTKIQFPLLPSILRCLWTPIKS